MDDLYKLKIIKSLIKPEDEFRFSQNMIKAQIETIESKFCPNSMVSTGGDCSCDNSCVDCWNTAINVEVDKTMRKTDVY